jgi:hypothetical protein
MSSNILLRISAFFLGSAVLLSTATQFRFGSFGLGEIFGALGIVCVLIVTRTVPVIAIRYLYGIGIIAVGMIFGLLTNIVIFDEEFRALDLWAMLYGQITACAILLVGLRTGRPTGLILPALLAFPLIQISLVILSVLGLIHFPVWYGGEDDMEATVPFVNRFMGWSLNPNQLGISLSALPFWLIFFLRGTSRLSVRIMIVFALAASFVCALLVNSNTVLVAWISGCLILASRFAWKSLRRTPILLPLILAALLSVVGLTKDFLIGLLEKGDDADLNGRLPIWLTSMERWASSPIFGLGPGPHVSTSPGGLTQESHMLLLDLLTQGGIVATLGMVYLFWISLQFAIKSRHPPAVAGTFALFIEALAHNTQRHPIFWVYLILPMLIFIQMPASRQSVRGAIEQTA